MKKFLLLTALIVSTTALADTPQFDNLSDSNVKDISKEFSANFAHTGVSAPETDGIWGVEVGLVAGKTATPELKDVVDESGGDGSDFKNLFHAGLMVRGHFPLDIFAEINMLPEKEISDVKIKNTSLELGWNAGAFFSLPLDLAIAASRASSKMSFDQTDPVASTISIESKTTLLWVGVSKKLLFFTPYFKLGTAKSDSDVEATVTVFSDADTKKTADNSGAYAALGANLQFAFLKLGFEGSTIMGVKRASGKLSLDF